MNNVYGCEHECVCVNMRAIMCVRACENKVGVCANKVCACDCVRRVRSLCPCSLCVSVPHLVVVRSALVAQHVLVGENRGSRRDVALELGIRGVVDLVISGVHCVKVGDTREQVVERGMGQRRDGG